MYVESHAHYDFKQFDKDRNELLSGLPAAGVTAVVNVGESIMSSYRSLKLSREYAFVYASVGVHPHNAKDMTSADLDTIRKLVMDPRCVAVGEIGLDYYHMRSSRENQLKWFQLQLEIAIELEVPVILHCRDAVSDMLEILRRYKVSRGVVHCFTEDVEAAIAFEKMGLYLGIGGVLTFPNAGEIIKGVRAVGLSRLLLETDCPYLAPEPHRGKRNDSRLIVHICDKVAQVLDVSHDEVAKVTSNNTRDLFGLI